MQKKHTQYVYCKKYIRTYLYIVYNIHFVPKFVFTPGPRIYYARILLVGFERVLSTYNAVSTEDCILLLRVKPWIMCKEQQSDRQNVWSS